MARRAIALRRERSKRLINEAAEERIPLFKDNLNPKTSNEFDSMVFLKFIF